MQYTENFRALKIEKFRWKTFNIFLIFAQNIDCQGGSNEYPQSMFWSKYRKIGIPCIPHFYYIKGGFKGVFIARTCFPDETSNIA